MFHDLLNCHKVVKCGAPRGLIPTVLVEPVTLLGSRQCTSYQEWAKSGAC